MYRELHLGNDIVPMEANATTPIRYKQIFNESLFQYFNEGLQGDIYVEVAGKLGYVMAMQAAKADMGTLNYGTYWDWLESLTGTAIALGANNIIDLYMGNQETESKAKKKVKADRPSET